VTVLSAPVVALSFFLRASGTGSLNAMGFLQSGIQLVRQFVKRLPDCPPR
jgi:hypothetical protein